MSLAYRQRIQDNSGVSTLQLYGHPNVLYTPSVVSGSSLYSIVDTMTANITGKLLGDAFLSYTILLTDGQVILAIC